MSVKRLIEEGNILFSKIVEDNIYDDLEEVIESHIEDYTEAEKEYCLKHLNSLFLNLLLNSDMYIMKDQDCKKLSTHARKTIYKIIENENNRKRNSL